MYGGGHVLGTSGNDLVKVSKSVGIPTFLLLGRLLPQRGQFYAQGGCSSGCLAIPSSSAACCQGFRSGAGAAGRGAVSRMKRSSAATTAAASSADALGATMVNLGRRFTT